MTEIVIYGASGHANAVKSTVETGGLGRVIAFVDDFGGDQGKSLGGRPIVSFDTWRSRHRDAPCFIAIADPAVKRVLAARVAEAGGTFCYFHRVPPPEVSIGAGSLLGQHVYVGPNTRIADHVSVMPLSSIGHDVTIGAHCTICPSSTIGGHVEIADDVFIGAGSTIINGKVNRPLTIGTGALIAAGAVVMKSVAAGMTVMGNPARPLRDLAGQRRGNDRRPQDQRR